MPFPPPVGLSFMKKLIFALLLAATSAFAQLQVPATTVWSRAFLRQTNGANAAAYMGIETNASTYLLTKRIGIVAIGHSVGTTNPAALTGATSPTASTQLAFGMTNPPYIIQLMSIWTNLGVNITFYTNTCSGGQTASNINANAATLLDGPIAVAKANSDFVIAFEEVGNNDIHYSSGTPGGNVSAEVAANSLSNLWYRTKIVDGADAVVAFQDVASITSDEADLANLSRLNYYSAIASNLWDYMVPFKQVFQPGPKGTNFASPYSLFSYNNLSSDGIHPNVQGGYILAQLVDSVIRNSNPHEFPYPVIDYSACAGIDAVFAGDPFYLSSQNLYGLFTLRCYSIGGSAGSGDPNGGPCSLIIDGGGQGSQAFGNSIEWRDNTARAAFLLRQNHFSLFATNDLGLNQQGMPKILDVDMVGGSIAFLVPLISTNGIVSKAGNGVSPTTITVTASPANFTNSVANGAGTNNVQVFIDGSGVTGTVKVNGTTIYSALVGADVNVILQPGEYVTVTYSIGTPVIKWKSF